MVTCECCTKSGVGDNRGELYTEGSQGSVLHDPKRNLRGYEGVSDTARPLYFFKLGAKVVLTLYTYQVNNALDNATHSFRPVLEIL